ncbi:uncharacterized protein RSE6_14111 [Rhynchosporium secalis]|uniref:Uncharacterized protein n=1 Tax=Rhynchosporium secalis TaxID=38038 RepID=A0A1E1MUG6_RHYSE|nr:uncharacterized protein RSE6_14111 [Rhynchosporium secalis]
MADIATPLLVDEKHNWALITSQIDAPESPIGPQADMKETVDIADVLSKLDDERRERNASDAPQPLRLDDAEPPISVPFGNGIQVDVVSAPEVAIGSPTSSGPTLLRAVTTESGSEPKVLEDNSPPPRVTKILGLQKKAFWITFSVVLTLALGIIAGTVAGVLSSRKTSRPETPKKKMPFKMQTWENIDKTGSSQIFYLEGLYTTAFGVRSYEWIPGKYTNAKDMDACSMALCFGDHQMGWRGGSRFSGNNTIWPGYEFADMVILKCGAVYANPMCPLTKEGVTMTAPIYEAPAPTGLGAGNRTVSGMGTTTSSLGTLTTGVAQSTAK